MISETADLIYVIHGKDADGFPVDTEQGAVSYRVRP